MVKHWGGTLSKGAGLLALGAVETEHQCFKKHELPLLPDIANDKIVLLYLPSYFSLVKSYKVEFEVSPTSLILSQGYL